MSAPHDRDMCPSNVREDSINGLSLECGLRELGLDFGPRVHPFPTIPTRSCTHDTLVKRYMDFLKKTVGKADLGASSGAEGWKDVLQLLKEQNEKKEKVARALSEIQKGKLRNNPGLEKNSVNEAAEVLGGMLNTHRCLLESGVELQKRLETHPASKKIGVFRRLRSTSLGDTLKTQTKGKKRAAPSGNNSAWYQDASRRAGL